MAAARLAELENENTRLRDQIDEVREECLQLREILERKSDLSFPAEWGLTPSEAAILRLLATRQYATFDALDAVLQPHRTPRSKPGETGSSLVVFVTRLRNKLPADVPIQSWRHQGYLVNDEALQRLNAYASTPGGGA